MEPLEVAAHTDTFRARLVGNAEVIRKRFSASSSRSRTGVWDITS